MAFTTIIVEFSFGTDTQSESTDESNVWQLSQRLHTQAGPIPLAFIDAYTRVHRRPPAERKMQRHFGVTPPSVHHMILTLERAGLIRRQPGVPRSIEVLVPPEDLPVLQANIQPVKRAWRGGPRKGESLLSRPDLRLSSSLK